MTRYAIPLEHLYGLRMVVMMEDQPQSNQYRVVKLTQKQFDAIAKVVSPQKVVDDALPLGDDLVDLPDIMDSFYDREE